MTQSARQSVPAATSDLRSLREVVQHDLERVNQVITEQVKSDIQLISDVAMHLIGAGGKRLRPSLTLAAASVCGYQGERHVRLAAAVEFIHTATLLHDDVVDESTLRRGEETANSRWSNQSSVLVGDFLLSRAFQLMVADGSLDALKILSDAAAIISAGEVQQLMVSHDMGITQDTYEEVIGAKTAELFAAACELGAVVSGRAEWRTPLRVYGQALGMAFQLIDDALDYAASSEQLGKSIGDDFREGKVTLPVLLAYQLGTNEERAFWEAAIEYETDDMDKLLHQAKQLLVKHRTVEATIARAEGFSKEAIAALAPLPDNAAKRALIEAAEFAVQRAY